VSEQTIVVLERDQDHVVVALSEQDLRGDLSDLRWRLDDRVLEGARTLTVDLSRLDRLSSATIAVLLRAKRCCRVRGGRLVLRQPSTNAVRTLRRTGLADIFDIEPARSRRSAPGMA